METPINQLLALDNAGVQLGAFDLALTVAPDANPDTSGDNEPGGGISPQVGGGCNAGGAGGGASGGLALGLLACVVRRRRR